MLTCLVGGAEHPLVRDTIGPVVLDLKRITVESLIDCVVARLSAAPTSNVLETPLESKLWWGPLGAVT